MTHILGSGPLEKDLPTMQMLVQQLGKDGLKMEKDALLIEIRSNNLYLATELAAEAYQKRFPDAGRLAIGLAGFGLIN